MITDNKVNTFVLPNISPVLCKLLGDFWAFWEREIFSKDRLNRGKYETMKIWWIWKIEIWSEELVDGYQTVPFWWNRELTLKCKLKCYVKPMKDPLSVSPSNQGTTRGKEKILLTSVGIEPTTSGWLSPFVVLVLRSTAFSRFLDSLSLLFFSFLFFCGGGGSTVW